MTGLLYLGALVGAGACLALVDHRFGLVLWRDARRALVVLGAGLVLFVAWDLAAIAAGHYRMGASEAMTGVVLAPDLPVEEIAFILFLCYVTLVVHGLVGLVLDRAPKARGRVAAPEQPVEPS